MLILQLTRPLICLDCETTGLDTQTARIVELGFQMFVDEFPAGLKKEWRTLVNPGVPIPADATRTHKITDDDFKRCRHCKQVRETHEPIQSCDAFTPWPTFKQLALNLAKGFSNCDFAGANIRYDLRVLAAEFDRSGVAWSYLDAYVVDANRLEQLGEPRSLSDLYKKHTGSDLIGAHGALEDVKATSEVIAAQLAKYDKLPRDLKRLHELQWPNWIDGSGKFRFVDGVPCFTQWGKHANKPMNHPSVNAVERGSTYWDFIIGADFPADVKQLAREAKLGKYPEPK